MRCISVEHDLAQRAATRVVVALEVTLEDQTPLAHDDDAVKIPNALVGDCLVEPRFKIGCEACFAISGQQGPLRRGWRAGLMMASKVCHGPTPSRITGPIGRGQ